MTNGRSISVGLLLAAGLLSAIPAVSSAGLEEKFQIGRAQAQYVVLLDTSGSMQPFFPQVMDAVHTLLQALPPEDILTVYRFDDFPVRLCSDVVKTLNLAACLPAAVNRDRGSRTEIGETFEKALDEIEASRASVFVLFFLTDGREEPRHGGRFHTNHEDAWAALSARGHRLSKEKELWGYGLGLSRYTDVNLLARIIPQGKVEVVTMSSPAELRSRIEGLRNRVRRTWLASEVRKELGNGFLELLQVNTPRVEQGRVRVAYAIRSTYPHLDVQPISLSRGNSIASLKLEMESPLALPVTGQSQAFSVSFELPSHSPWRLGRTTIQREERLILVAAPVFADATEIRSLGLDPQVTLRGFEAGVAYSYRVGVPFGFLVTFLLSLGGFVLCTRNWIRIPSPEVFGVLSADDLPSRDLVNEHRARLRVGGSDQDVVVPGVKGAFEIEARRVGTSEMLFVRPVHGQVELEGRILSSFADEGLQQDVVKLAIDGKVLLLTGISPRGIRGRRWGMILILLVSLLVLNAVTWNVSP